MRNERERDWVPLSADMIVSLAWFLGIPVSAALAGLLLPLLGAARGRGDMGLFAVAIAVAALGIAGLAVAKYPLWRQGRFTTVGPSGLKGFRRHLYWAAYALVVLGAFLLGSLIVAVCL